jgi:hypothetical protein
MEEESSHRENELLQTEAKESQRHFVKKTTLIFKETISPPFSVTERHRERETACREKTKALTNEESRASDSLNLSFSLSLSLRGKALVPLYRYKAHTWMGLI